MLEQHCYDWHSALAIPSIAFFLLSFRNSAKLQCSPSDSLNCHDNVLQKPDEARRPPQSRGLCSPLQMTARFHLFSWRKTKRKDWTGDKAAQLNTPERLTPHTLAGAQIATRICKDLGDQKWSKYFSAGLITAFVLDTEIVLELGVHGLKLCCFLMQTTFFICVHLYDLFKCKIFYCYFCVLRTVLSWNLFSQQ